MLAEPGMGPWLPTSIVLNCHIWGVTPRFLLSASLPENLSAHPIVIPTKVIIRKVTLANQVPPVALLNGTLRESLPVAPERLDPG